MHEFDNCIIASKNGTKLAEGFVHDYEGVLMKVCLEGEFNLLVSQDVTIFAFNRIKGECVYKGRVADVDDKNITIDQVEFVRATQKRNHTRVEQSLHYRITHRYVGDIGVTEKLEKPIDLLILNISAHGMFISCDEKFSVGHKFPFVFRDAGAPIHLEVAVVRCEYSRRGNKYGCSFLNISEKDSDNIYRFVLHEQIEQRRRNLLF